MSCSKNHHTLAFSGDKQRSYHTPCFSAKYRYFADLFEYVETKGKGFVMNDSAGIFWGSCQHDWVVLDCCFACCRICGAGHECHRGQCPETKTENSSSVCTITGIVTVNSEFREERNIHERVTFAGHYQSSRFSALESAGEVDEEMDDDVLFRNESSAKHHHSIVEDEFVSVSSDRNVVGKRKRRGLAGKSLSDSRHDDAETHSTNNKNKKKKRISVVEMNMWLAAASVASSSASSDPWPAHGTSAHGGGFVCPSNFLSSGMNPYRIMILSVFNESMNKVHETVESVVSDILSSDKTYFCFMQEIDRNEGKLCSLFSKLLRETAHSKHCLRPNILNLFTQVYYHARKCRLSYNGFVYPPSCMGQQHQELERDCRKSHARDKKKNHTLHDHCNKKRFPCSVVSKLVKTCTESIVNLLMSYGGLRVVRHLQNVGRRREFICSMLYLMRMGITYQNRQLLPKIDMLHEYLPMQVLLPVVFKIRAKSITEGENIIKLDIRKMPL